MKTQEIKTDELTSSMEDYLEAIAVLKQDNGVARVRDISVLLNVKKPSVTGALNILVKKGFVIHEKYGYVELTSKGEKVAKSVKGKHDVLIKFLTNVLGIKKSLASIEACKMEHSISFETFQRFTKFIKFIETSNNKKRPKWLREFDSYIEGKKVK